MFDNVYILEIPKKEKLIATSTQKIYSIKYFDKENVKYTYESYYIPYEVNDILDHNYHIRRCKLELLREDKHLVEMKYLPTNNIIYKTPKKKIIKFPYKRHIPQPYDFEKIPLIKKFKNEVKIEERTNSPFKKKNIKK